MLTRQQKPAYALCGGRREVLMIKSLVISLGLMMALSACDNEPSEANLAAQQEQTDVDLCLEKVLAQSNNPEKAEQVGVPEIIAKSSSREIRGKVKLVGGTGTVVPYLYICTVVQGVVVNSVLLPG